MEVAAMLASVPAVIAMVTILKDLGMPTRLGAAAAVLAGVLTSLAGHLAMNMFGHWYEAVATGVLVGLGAAGVYDGAKIMGSGKYNQHSSSEPQ